MNTIKDLNEKVIVFGTTQARHEVDWSKFSNENLKFTLDLLALHQSPYEVEVANEIQIRRVFGTWYDIAEPPPLLTTNAPKWLYLWPFRLFWKQLSRGRG